MLRPTDACQFSILLYAQIPYAACVQFGVPLPAKNITDIQIFFLVCCYCLADHNVAGFGAPTPNQLAWNPPPLPCLPQ